MDYSEFKVRDKINNEAFGHLNDLITRLVKAEKAVTECEAALKKAQEERRQLDEFEIPTFMDSIDLSKFKTTSGIEIEVSSKIRASVGSNKVAAFRWLIDNGHGGVVKRSVEVSFNVNQESVAKKLEKELRERSLGAGVRQNMKVEAATLTALVKKILKDGGQDIPYDVFGIYEQRFVKISMPQE